MFRRRKRSIVPVPSDNMTFAQRWRFARLLKSGPTKNWHPHRLSMPQKIFGAMFYLLFLYFFLMFLGVIITDALNRPLAPSLVHGGEDWTTSATQLPCDALGRFLFPSYCRRLAIRHLMDRPLFPVEPSRSERSARRLTQCTPAYPRGVEKAEAKTVRSPP